MKALIYKIKSFDYFNLGNSFSLYYLFIFFTLPLIHLIGTDAPYLASLKTRTALNPKVSIFLFLGLLSFYIAYRNIKFQANWFSRLGLDKEWKKKNVPWSSSYEHMA